MNPIEVVNNNFAESIATKQAAVESVAPAIAGAAAALVQDPDVGRQGVELREWRVSG